MPCDLGRQGERGSPVQQGIGKVKFNLDFYTLPNLFFACPLPQKLLRAQGPDPRNMAAVQVRAPMLPPDFDVH